MSCHSKGGLGFTAYTVLGIAASALLIGVRSSNAQITYQVVSSTDWRITNGLLTVDFNPTKSNINNLQVGVGANAGGNILDPGNSQLYPEFAGTPFGAGAFSAHVDQTTNYIDFSTTTQSTGTSANPITYSFHYVMYNNDPAIHTYEVLNHSASDPATSVGQGQFLMRVDPKQFSELYQVNTSPNNLGPQISNLPTTTAQLAEVNGNPSGYGNANRLDLKEVLDLNGDPDLESLIGRNFLNKYDYSSYEQFHQAQTEIGPKYAISNVVTSQDTMTGGPTKQNLQFTNNILMTEFLSGHYGTGTAPSYSYTPQQGVNTTKLFGPYTFRVAPVSNETDTQLYQDAVNSAAAYPTLFDQDQTLLNNGYVASTARGTVQLSVANPAGWDAANTNNNNIVLSDQHTNMQETTSGNQYWTQLSANGTGNITGVTPGTYRASIYEYGQWGESRYDGVQVQGNKINAPTNLQFTPENFGATAPIFNIGTPNRSANEFLNGHITAANSNAATGQPGYDNRNYFGSYDYWGQEAALGNPGKVVYYGTGVGSHAATNDPNKWIANQWRIFDPALYDPANNSKDLYSVEQAGTYVGNPATYGGSPWEAHFTTTPAQSSQGAFVTLSVGLAAAEGSLTVNLNGNSRVWHVTGQSDPMIRSGVAGFYQYLVFEWPVSVLNAAGADDLLTFSVSQNNGVIYDALRLEIGGTADPAVTGWHDYFYVNTGSGTTNTSPPLDAFGLAAVNSVVVPEPASLLVLGLMGLPLLRPRRKQR